MHTCSCHTKIIFKLGKWIQAIDCTFAVYIDIYDGNPGWKPKITSSPHEIFFSVGIWGETDDRTLVCWRYFLSGYNLLKGLKLLCEDPLSSPIISWCQKRHLRAFYDSNDATRMQNTWEIRSACARSRAFRAGNIRSMWEKIRCEIKQGMTARSSKILFAHK